MPIKAEMFLARALSTLKTLSGDIIYSQTSAAMARRATIMLPKKVLDRASQHISNRYFSHMNAGLDKSDKRKLKIFYEIFPNDQRLATIYLRNHLYPETDQEVVSQVQNSTHPSILDRPELKLLLLFYRIKSSGGISIIADSDIIDLDLVKYDRILADIWRICYINYLVWNASELMHLEITHFENYLGLETDPNVLFEILYKVAIEQRLSVSLQDLAPIIAQTCCAHSVECCAVAYSFLMSFGIYSEASKLESSISLSPFAKIHPLYIKSKLAPVASNLAPFENDFQFPPTEDFETKKWQWRDAELQKHEILARIKFAHLSHSQTVVTNKSIDHLLVIFFGQMRNPEKTVPHIKDWIKKDFSSHFQSDQITIGVSTWQKTGIKKLSHGDHIDTLVGYLPLKIVTAAKELGLCTIADLSEIFPITIKTIIDRSFATTEIDQLYLRELLSEEVFTDIKSEAEFFLGLGGLLRQAVGDNIPLLNQGRMLDRISAAKNIACKAENARGPITHYLFIRPDLWSISGSLASNVNNLVDERGWAVCDEDSYAQIQDGVGDRLILCDKLAANCIFQIEEFTKHIFNDSEERLQLYRKRLSPHQMLRTVMFEQGIMMRTIRRSKVAWKLYRGQGFEDMTYKNITTDLVNNKNDSLREKFLQAHSDSH